MKKRFICIACGQKFSQKSHKGYIKTSLPQCPICESTEVKLDIKKIHILDKQKETI